MATAREQFNLKNVRLSFASLFTPKAGINGGDEKFQASFILPKNDPQVDKIRATISRLCKEAWGAQAAATQKMIEAQDRVCLHDGDTKAYEGYDGNMFISSSSLRRPTVLDRDRSPLTEADGRPYSGCYVNAVVNLWVQDNQFGKRVNAELMGVQFYKDGDSFSGGAPLPAEAFEDLSGDEDSLL